MAPRRLHSFTSLVPFSLFALAGLSSRVAAAASSTSLFPNGACAGAGLSRGGFVGIGLVTLGSGVTEKHCGCISDELPAFVPCPSGVNGEAACRSVLDLETGVFEASCRVVPCEGHSCPKTVSNTVVIDQQECSGEGALGLSTVDGVSVCGCALPEDEADDDFVVCPSIANGHPTCVSVDSDFLGMAYHNKEKASCGIACEEGYYLTPGGQCTKIAAIEKRQLFASPGPIKIVTHSATASTSAASTSPVPAITDESSCAAPTTIYITVTATPTTTSEALFTTPGPIKVVPTTTTESDRVFTTGPIKIVPTAEAHSTTTPTHTRTRSPRPHVSSHSHTASTSGSASTTVETTFSGGGPIKIVPTTTATTTSSWTTKHHHGVHTSPSASTTDRVATTTTSEPGRFVSPGPIKVGPGPSQLARRDFVPAQEPSVPEFMFAEEICAAHERVCGTVNNFTCVRLDDVKQCGGCNVNNDAKDCSALPGVSVVSCLRGGCVVRSCLAGFAQTSEGSCSPKV